ncbi:MAG: prepilin-type N-terminal cleavage/methylation domain-containing protein [Candidatus Omnitrophota bacterium]
MDGKNRYDKAFTLVEILIVVGVIGIVSAITVPNYVRARTAANKNACISNLNHIRDAVDMWALDTNAAVGAQPPHSDLVPSYIRTWPKCLNAAYDIPAVGDDPACPNEIADHVLPSAGGGGS